MIRQGKKMFNKQAWIHSGNFNKESNFIARSIDGIFIDISAKGKHVFIFLERPEASAYIEQVNLSSWHFPGKLNWVAS